MNIILFADKLPPDIGGMETHAKYFVNYFSGSYDLSIISNEKGYDILVDTSFRTVKRIDLFEFIKGFEYDSCIVFYNSGFWIEDFYQIKRSLKRAFFVYRTGGNEINKAPLSLNIKSHVERQQYWVKTINDNIDQLIANSQFTRKRLLNLGIRREIIRIISGGVDITQIDKAISSTEQTRKLLNCGKNDKVVVSTCRFVPYKRNGHLVRIFSHLPKYYRFIFAGDGQLFEETLALAAELGLNAVFLGKLAHEESLNIIAAADVYCQASTDLTVKVLGGSYVHTEGMGRSLIEAICSGVRVVMTNSGAVSEFINSENGIIAEDDEVLYANRIEQILALPAMTEKSRRVYCEEYSFENIFKKYESLWS